MEAVLYIFVAMWLSSVCIVVMVYVNSVYNTISCLDFRKSLSSNQPHLLTEGPETNDQFGVVLCLPMHPIIIR